MARGLIPNTERAYKNLGAAISDGRLNGLISWRAIEDRTRFLRGNTHWDDPQSIVRAVAQQFKVDWWEEQDHRVEVWIEKDALVGVIEGVCNRLDVDYFSCRGYVSQSEMWAAAQRIGRYLRAGQTVTVLHLGDHDPSGIDMTRDIEQRLSLFCASDSIYAGAVESRLEREGLLYPTVRRIGLTMEQIDELNPPPNPAKVTDSRAMGYISQYGDQSWELDALDPAYMTGLIEEHVRAIADEDALLDAEGRQLEARRQLNEVATAIEEEGLDAVIAKLAA